MEYGSTTTARDWADYPEARAMIETRARASVRSLRVSRKARPELRSELAAALDQALQMSDERERARRLNAIDTRARQALAHTR